MSTYRLEVELKQMKVYCAIAYGIAALAVGALLAVIIKL